MQIMRWMTYLFVVFTLLNSIQSAQAVTWVIDVANDKRLFVPLHAATQSELDQGIEVLGDVIPRNAQHHCEKMTYQSMNETKKFHPYRLKDQLQYEYLIRDHQGNWMVAGGTLFVGAIYLVSKAVLSESSGVIQQFLSFENLVPMSALVLLTSASGMIPEIGARDNPKDAVFSHLLCSLEVGPTDVPSEEIQKLLVQIEN